MPFSRRAHGLVLAALLLGLLLSLAGGAAALAAGAEAPQACEDPRLPVDAIGTTPCPQDPGPGDPAPSQVRPPAEPERQGEGEPGVKFGEQEEPTGWSGPIAKDLGQGVQGLASDLAEQLKDGGLLPKFEFSRAYLSLYAVMYGLGVAVAAMATMVAAVKVAAASGVDARIMAQHALVRLLTFSAVGAMAPLLLAKLGELAKALAGGFLYMAAGQLASQLDWLAGALAVGSMASVVVPGGSAVMVGLFLFLLASLAAIWLELAISQYLIFLLGLFIPILYATSINPDWRRGMLKLRGGLLGAFLAPAALFLVWVVAGSAVSPWTSDNGFFTRAGMLLVGLLISLAAPIAIGLVLSYVVPALAGGHGYESGAVTAAVNRIRQQRGRGSRPLGPRSSRATRASEATDGGPGTPVERLGATARSRGSGAPAPAASAEGAAAGGASGAGAAASSAAGAAGPIAAAAMVWTKLVGEARGAAEGTQDTVATSARGAGERGADDAGQGSTSGGPGQGGRGAERSGTSGPPPHPSRASDIPGDAPVGAPRGRSDDHASAAGPAGDRAATQPGHSGPAFQPASGDSRPGRPRGSGVDDVGGMNR